MSRVREAAGLLLVLAAVPGFAADRELPEVSVAPAIFRSAAPKSRAAASDLALSGSPLPASARHELGPLTATERARLSGHDTGSFGEKVNIVGVVRELAGTTGGLVERRGDRTSWTAAFVSPGAAGLRLRVEAPGLPEGSRAYVYAAGGTQVHGPYSARMLARPGGFWTNTVFAEEALLEVQLPVSWPDGVRIRVRAVGHIDGDRAFPGGRAKDADGAIVEDCPLDIRCVASEDFPRIEEASRAVAMIYYEGAGFLGQCTASLLNTTAGPVAPYLLTANHCVSTAAAAASIEAFWSFVASSCGAVPPGLETVPRSLGASLLATESYNGGSDYTLVELDEDPPDDSIFLGWTTRSLADGASLNRISHPEGLPQSYSHHVAAAREAACTLLAPGDGVPTVIDRAMTLGGSSGAALLTGDLEVVGQLWGGCGRCGTPPPQTRDNDGAFRASYPDLRRFLDPVGPGPCVPGGEVLCLNGGRFSVDVTWRRVHGETGAGQAEPLTADSGYFWFFDSANIELVVKVLNACGLDQHFWVFAGGLTNVEVVMTVTDTETDVQKVYTNPLGTAFLPLQDTSAFATCP